MAREPRKNKKRSIEKIPQMSQKVPLTQEQENSIKDPADVIEEKFAGMTLKEIEKTDSPYAEDKMKAAAQKIINEVQK